MSGSCSMKSQWSDKAYEIFRNMMEETSKDKAIKLINENPEVINEQDVYGKTLLMWACRDYRYFEILEQIVDIDIKDNHGDTALMHVAMKGNFRAVKMLLSASKNVEKSINMKNEIYQTALMIASENGHCRVAEELLSYPDIKFNIQQKYNDYTALIHACKLKHTEIVKILVSKIPKELLNIKCRFGKTSLMYACEGWNEDCAEIMISAVDPDSLFIQDNNGDIALSLTWGKRYKTFAKLISIMIKIRPHFFKVENKRIYCVIQKLLEDYYITSAKEFIYAFDFNVGQRTIFDIVRSKNMLHLYDLNTGCDNLLLPREKIAGTLLSSLHSLRSDKWLNLF